MRHLVDVRMLPQQVAPLRGVVALDFGGGQLAALDDLLRRAGIQEPAAEDERQAMAALRSSM